MIVAQLALSSLDRNNHICVAITASVAVSSYLKQHGVNCISN
jgi:hypothetical protein